MISSLRPRGTVSVSMSVTKPCWYSRLASSWMVLVAVVIVSSRSESFACRRCREGRSTPGEGRQRDQGKRLEHLRRQLRPQPFGDLPLALEEVRQGDLVQDAPHP